MVKIEWVYDYLVLTPKVITYSLYSMSESLTLGALEIETNTYTSPADATKDKQYKCADCEQKVIFRKGTVRRPHFAHYSPTNVCTYYEHPSEAQIHKDAKLLMSKLLTERKNIQFVWDCHYCKTSSISCAFSGVPTITYRDGDEVVLEYRDKGGKWIADVAVVNSGEVRYIIEIKNTHATTTTSRPEPWYEVGAQELIGYVNSDYVEPGFSYMLPCVRQGIQRYCYGSFCYKEHWVNHIPGYDSKATDRACILCKYEEYVPVNDGATGKFQKKEIRVCMPCLRKDTYEKKLRERYMSAQMNEVVTPITNPVAKQVSDSSGCDGSGFCFVQGNTGYSRKTKCPHNCKLMPCKTCGYMLPLKVLQCHNGKCMSCNSNLYLEVPYARKDEAKAMGAMWEPMKKKWYIIRWATNRQEVLKKFKECTD